MTEKQSVSPEKRECRLLPSLPLSAAYQEDGFSSDGVNGCGQTENNATPCKTPDTRPVILHFPRTFTLALPLGQHLAFYGDGGPVTVMAWDSHCDSGWCLGTFADWPEAMAAGLVHQAEMFASYGGGAK